MYEIERQICLLEKSCALDRDRDRVLCSPLLKEAIIASSKRVLTNIDSGGGGGGIRLRPRVPHLEIAVFYPTKLLHAPYYSPDGGARR